MTADNRLPEPVGYVAQRSLDSLTKCRDDDHNGYVNLWMRPVPDVDATQPVVTLAACEAYGAALLAARDAERGDAADAARYRFLRSQRWNTAGIPFIARNEGHGFSMWTGEHADTAIDAAMKADAGRREDDNARS